MKRCPSLFSKEPNASSVDRFPLVLPHFELLELPHQTRGSSSPIVHDEEESGGANRDRMASSQGNTQGQAGSGAALRHGSEGPRASLQASDENIFGHFQMSGNSNREFLCPNYGLSCAF